MYLVVEPIKIVKAFKIRIKYSVNWIEMRSNRKSFGHIFLSIT